MWCRMAWSPTNKFLKDQTDPSKLYIIGKGIYHRSRFVLDIDKIFLFCDFKSDFCEIVKFRSFFEILKSSTLFKCRQVTHHFEADDLEN